MKDQTERFRQRLVTAARAGLTEPQAETAPLGFAARVVRLHGMVHPTTVALGWFELSRVGLAVALGVMLLSIAAQWSMFRRPPPPELLSSEVIMLTLVPR